MSDERPRPQYGEYASPDEARAARGLSAEELAAEAVALAGPPDPGTRSTGPTAPPAASPGSRPPGSEAMTGRAVGAPARTDLLVTIALLVAGLASLLRSIPSYLDFPTALAPVIASVGITGVDLGSGARVAGYVLLAVEVLLLVGSGVLAALRIRAGRRAFWVPLAGFALYAVASTIAITVLLGPALATLGQNPS